MVHVPASWAQSRTEKGQEWTWCYDLSFAHSSSDTTGVGSFPTNQSSSALATSCVSTIDFSSDLTPWSRCTARKTAPASCQQPARGTHTSVQRAYEWGFPSPPPQTLRFARAAPRARQALRLLLLDSDTGRSSGRAEERHRARAGEGVPSFHALSGCATRPAPLWEVLPTPWPCQRFCPRGRTDGIPGH